MTTLAEPVNNPRIHTIPRNCRERVGWTAEKMPGQDVSPFRALLFQGPAAFDSLTSDVTAS